MCVALYARVSTTRQAQTQTIDQQLSRLRTTVADRGWTLDEQHVYRDDGYSGASLSRPGLDRLRDHAGLADLEVVLVTAPDRLARNYVHQVLLIEELERHGCRVEFLDRPMSQDPHDQLLLQIRGAVAEYERTLISERMRRGRLTKLRAGTLLPWTRPPFGYRLDPERPREAAGLRVEPSEAVLVEQLFDWYLEPRATLYQMAKRLTDLGVLTPTGKPRWNVATVRGILHNPAYTGAALTNRTRVAPARVRKSAMLPVGPGHSHARRPPEDWITIPVPAIVRDEVFAQVQAKLATNQQAASRNNTQQAYLLRALVSCGACHLSCMARTTGRGYSYYLCRGRTDALRQARGERCTARYTPAQQVDDVVWQDLCALLTDPAQVAHALERARGGAWLPQELQARQATIRQALDQLARQQQRLLDAYLAEVLGFAEFERKRHELDRRQATLLGQQRQLDALAQQRLELSAVASGIEEFCATVRAGLATASFTQRRLLVELLIDRVIVRDSEVEVRYVLPASRDGPQRRFCHLRKDHLDRPAQAADPHQRPPRRGGRRVAQGVLIHGWFLRRRQRPAHHQPARGAGQPVAHQHATHGDELGDQWPRAPVEDAVALPAGGRHPGRPGVGRHGRRAVRMPPFPVRCRPTPAGSLRRYPGPRPRPGRRPIGRGQRPELGVAGHLRQVPQALPCEVGAQVLVVTEARIADRPPGAHRPIGQRPVHQRGRELRLGAEGRVVGDAAGHPAVARRRREPSGRQIQPTVEQRLALPAGIAQEDTGLAGVLLAGRPAPLPGHPGRVLTLLGDVAAVDEEHRVVLAQRRIHQPAMDRQQVVVIPGRRADAVLERAHLPVGRRPRSPQAQGHGLDVLARHVGGQQAAQIELDPGALIAAGETRREVGVVGGQLVGQPSNIGGGQGTGDGHLVAQVSREPGASHHRRSSSRILNTPSGGA
jgi:site-specific DNA recombinase